MVFAGFYIRIVRITNFVDPVGPKRDQVGIGRLGQLGLDRDVVARLDRK